MEGEIICPYCGEMQIDDDGQYPVSYYGSEEGAEKFQCNICEKVFLVEEMVKRWYSIKKTPEANPESVKRAETCQDFLERYRGVGRFCENCICLSESDHECKAEKWKELRC